MKDDKKKGKPKHKTAKKKKIEDENIIEEEQADINEADDTFGLPEVDFKPLDEVDEVDETKEEVTETQETDETTDEVSQEVEENAVDEIVYEEPAATEEESFNYPQDEVETEFEEDNDKGKEESDADSQDEGKGAEPAFKKKFKYEGEKSQAPKIIIGIVAVLIILAGIWYFGFYAPQQKAIAEKAAQEAAIAKKRAEDARKLADEQRQIAEEQQLLAQQAEEEAKPEPGQITILTEPTGRYYVVVGSFIDFFGFT